MIADLVKVAYFEAAHRNPNGGAAQQRMHGHRYKVEILARGAVDPERGWVVDYADLKRLYQPLEAVLDHGYLNELPGLEADASLPALRAWIEERLSPRPAWLRGVRVAILGDLAFRPVHLPADLFHELPERVRFMFEAAQSLPQLPEGHPRRNIHGHSYGIEVSAEGMDTLEPHLRALYDLLDHRYLNDIPGLGHATCENICRWVWRWLLDRGVHLTLLSVQETPGARCLYRGED